ncbi:hypothetical protein ABZP36_029056 [Zizania latifolia]
MEQPAIGLNNQPPEDGIIDLTVGGDEDEDVGFNTVGVPQEFDLNSFPQEVEDEANIDFDLNALSPDEEHTNFNGVQNIKKRRYYPDDLKVAMYLELLAKTSPSVLQRGLLFFNVEYQRQLHRNLVCSSELFKQCGLMEKNNGDIEGVPHMKKKRLEMEGRLPTTLECPVDLYNKAL